MAREAATNNMTRYLALMAVTAVFAACSNPAAPAHLGDTTARAAESAVATQEQVANTSSDGGAQASEGTATTVGRSSAGRTYRHLPEEFSPDACDVVYTLMDELASVIGDASLSLSVAQTDRLFSTQNVDWDTDDIEELLNGVTLGDQEAGALQWVVGRGYGIHFRHLWVWDWLHRECFAEFGEALSLMPERKAEMHVDFQRLDDLCMQLFRGSPNNCGNSSGMSRAAISMACRMAEERGRECSAQFEDGALVAGEFSIRDP